MLHFAYGSNMHVPMMRQRCPAARLEGCAVLHGYRFMITKDRFASVVPCLAASVHGVLWRLTPRDLAVLNADENLAGGLYRIAMLPVRARGRTMPALVYVGRSRAGGEARPGYMDVVVAAAEGAGFPPHYVRTLARLRGRPMIPWPSDKRPE